MEWKRYDNKILGEYEYVVADMPAGKRYRPGYVNEVKLIPREEGRWEAQFTDGYSLQILDYFSDYSEAREAAEKAIREGTGADGLNSRFEPNETEEI